MKAFKLLKRYDFKTCAFFHIFYIMFIVFSFSFSAAKERSVAEILRNRIEAGEADTPLVLTENETIRAKKVLQDFYSQRLFEPVWIGKEEVLPDGRQMINAILDAEKEGLNPNDYHIGKIEYGETDVLEVLKEASGAGRISESILDLIPRHSRYAGLREARSKYQKVTENGGWPEIENGPSIKAGNKDARISAIRVRLGIEGYTSLPVSDDPAIFDQNLLQAVMEFQRHYGLEPDGVIGPATLKAMNIPARQRTRQISLAMERWRWLPRDLGPNYIRVNIANFKLAVIENEDSVLDMRVIVGRTYRQTPVFSGKMTYLVLNPYWDVPRSIAVKDKLPNIKSDPEYLKNNHMKVFIGRGAESKELNPESIDWNEVTPNNFTYRLRQDPGPGNALGKIKFMFPNSYNVYLHDTPSRELFDRAVGAFSSGCIRLAKPIELAEYLLKDDSKWGRKTIMETVEKGRETTILLKKPIPVYLIYLTVLLNEDGTLDFRDDIYNRDKKLDEAMREMLPSAM